MSQTLCRLCLNTDRLIHVFDSRLRNAEQLRMNIMLCTGVKIQSTDVVSKHVCHNCCIIAIKLFKYRKTTVANDKALKELAGQLNEEPVSNTEEIIKLQNSILSSVSIVQNEESNRSMDVKKFRCDENADTSAVHWSIVELFKKTPKIVVPNQILKANIQPKVAIDPIDPDDFMSKPSVSNDEPDQKDLESFRRKFPGVDIVKISRKQDNVSPVTSDANVSTVYQESTSKNVETISVSNVEVENKTESTEESIVEKDTNDTYENDSDYIYDNWENMSDASSERSTVTSNSSKINTRNSTKSEINIRQTRSSSERPGSAILKQKGSENPIESRRSSRSGSERSFEILNKAALIRHDSEGVKKINDPKKPTDLHRKRKQSIRTGESDSESNKSVSSGRSESKKTRLLNNDCLLKKSVERRRKRNSSSSDSLEILPISKRMINVLEKQFDDVSTEQRVLMSSLELTETNVCEPESVDNVLIPIRETLQLHCSYCDKTYQKIMYLNKHMQTHRKCIVCSMMHPSDEALHDHFKAICYKTVVSNQPILQLERVDDNVLLLEQYREAFDFHANRTLETKDVLPNTPIEDVLSNTLIEDVLPNTLIEDVLPNTLIKDVLPDTPKENVVCISDDEDDDVLIVEDGSTKFFNGGTVENELAFIRSIFKKYENAKPKLESDKVDKFSQTIRPENCVKYCNDSQIVLENMFGDLSLFKVPLEMAVSSKVSARISYLPKLKQTYGLEKWPTDNVIDLKPKVKTTKNTNLLPKKRYTINEKYVTEPIVAVPSAIMAPSFLSNSLSSRSQNKENVLQHTTPNAVKPSTSMTENTVISQHINNNLVAPTISSVPQYGIQNVLYGSTNAITQNITQFPNHNLLPSVPQNNLIPPMMNTVAGTATQYPPLTVISNTTRNTVTYGVSEQHVSVANLTQSNAQGNYVINGGQQSTQNVMVSNTKTVSSLLLLSNVVNSLPRTAPKVTTMNNMQSAEPSSEKTLLRVKAPWELNQI